MEEVRVTWMFYSSGGNQFSREIAGDSIGFVLLRDSMPTNSVAGLLIGHCLSVGFRFAGHLF